MARSEDVDRLIREALEEEDVHVHEALAEPGLPDMVTEVFRGRMRWYGALFLFMILASATLAVYCAVRFFGTREVPEMLRWGGGFFVGFLAAQGGKTWYWMQHERLALIRELKRVELLVAHLATELRSR